MYSYIYSQEWEQSGGGGKPSSTMKDPFHLRKDQAFGSRWLLPYKNQKWGTHSPPQLQDSHT